VCHHCSSLSMFGNFPLNARRADLPETVRTDCVGLLGFRISKQGQTLIPARATDTRLQVCQTGQHLANRGRYELRRDKLNGVRVKVDGYDIAVHGDAMY
jgi:hypothetical protein